ncbi:MAG: ABC transporter ATP-binding protein [Proteobacteria bacterium]|nr:ABC transporter ATP-binding protein [Pseudomonadota bacterium]
MLEIANLTKTYQGVKALDNVSFSVNKGHVVGFLGANGAGKTTTMDIICGCIGSDKGHVKICGYDILDEPIQAKEKIGYLPDVPPLYRDMTVKESITYAVRLNGVAKKSDKNKKASVTQRVTDMISMLALSDVSHKLVGSLSKGYRQRVALAHALVHDPEVLVLDEPTEGLDPRQIAQIRDIILSLKEDKAIILSSHILQEVENLCDQLVIIDKGKIVTTGDFEDIANKFAGHSYVLSVRHYQDDLLGQIEGLSCVSKASKDDKNHIQFDLEKPEALDDVAKFVLDKGLGIKKLAPASSSLEGIFQNVTSQKQ